MRYLKNLRWEMLLYSILSVGIGVVMFLYPDKIKMGLSITLAVMLFIMAIRNLFEYRRENKDGNFRKYELVVAIILAAGGVAVLMFMDTILSIMTYIIGIIIIVSGLMKIENALDLRRMRSRWIPLLVISVICILLGVFIITAPMNQNDDGTHQIGNEFIKYIGVIFAFTGLIDLITTLSVSGKIRRWVRDCIKDAQEDEE